MIENSRKGYLIFAKVFFCLFVFMKQFYLFPSGFIGIGDVFLVISAIIVFVVQIFIEKEKFLYTIDFYWYIFIAFVVLINGFYFFKTKNIDFLKYIIYWLYSTVAIWTYRKLAGKQFFDKVVKVCEINIILQLLIYCFGLGRYYHEGWGGGRFMGTFNDPNQCAFFIFTMLLFIFMCQCHKLNLEFGIFFCLSVFVIYITKSTGMFLGIFMFGLILTLQKIISIYKNSAVKKIWNILFVVGILLICFSIYKVWPSENFDITQTDYTLMSRIQQKIWKFSHGNLADFLYDRSAERLLQYPQNLILGAGEGYFERFPLGDFVNKISPGVFVMEFTHEIHSSFFEIWYCYGIVPTVILIMWLIKNIKACDKKRMAAVMAILIESFFLVNYRQPFFWYILVYSSSLGLMYGECRK